MKYFSLFTFLLSLFVAPAQFKSTDKLISLLDNQQFIIDHNHKANFRIESKAAVQLIRKGKSTSGKLLKALENPDKTIMAHLVLSQIYFKKVSFAGPKIVIGETQDIFKYYLGEENGVGLIISEVKLHGKHKIYVEPKDIETIQNYWKTKITNTK